jgi:hypothetical protein
MPISREVNGILAIGPVPRASGSAFDRQRLSDLLQQRRDRDGLLHKHQARVARTLPIRAFVRVSCDENGSQFGPFLHETEHEVGASAIGKDDVAQDQVKGDLFSVEGVAGLG